MSEYESFSNPPVEEAIITMRLRPLDDPGALATALHERHPLFGSIDADPGRLAAADAISSVARYRLVSSTGYDVIAITEQAFSFHRLRPYTGWNAFVGSAREAWSAFAGLVPSNHVSSLELRYVHTFGVPEPVEHWDEYFRILLGVPHSLDRDLQNFLVSLNLVNLGIPGDATVTQATLPRGDSNTVPVIFDVDVRAVGAFPLHQTDDRMWRTLERMREYKNQIFFDGLTERAKELFR